MNIKDDFILSQINEGYLVGGAVRDFLQGKDKIFDRDIAIKDAEHFAIKIAKKFDGTFIVLDGENKIYRVVLKDKENYLDISEIQGSSIEEDLKRRDFTINAIAYDLENGEFIDVTGGIKDIENGIIKEIQEKNFEEDPLRILRAFRFMATTGYKLDKNTELSIKKYLSLALNPAKERIAYEIMKLFGGKYSHNAILKMDEIGLLEMIFPHIKDVKKVPPNTHHHLDLFHHSVETVKQIQLQYEKNENNIKEHLDKVDFGGFARINHLKLAGFLHDIGKFSTWTIEDSGRHRFIKHDDVGSKMVVPILKDLKFSKKQIEYISLMIKNHIYPSSVISNEDLNEKIMMRYIRKMGENVIDNIVLARADRYSAQGPAVTKEMTKANIDGLNKLLDFYFEKRDTLKPLPRLLDGKDIMKIKNINQSPLLGKIIKALNEAQLNGDVNSKDEAIEFVKNLD